MTADQLHVYEVTLRHEDLKLKVHCITKVSLKDELFMAFGIAFESLKTGCRRRKRSFFRRPAGHENEAELSESLNTQDELNNVGVSVEWLRPDVAEINITFIEKKSYNKKWCQKAMAEFGRTQMMSIFHLI